MKYFQMTFKSYNSTSLKSPLLYQLMTTILNQSKILDTAIFMRGMIVGDMDNGTKSFKHIHALKEN